LLGAPGGLFAGFGQGYATCGCEGYGAGEEADEVVHFGVEMAVEAVWSFCQNGEVAVLGVGEEVLFCAVERLFPHVLVDGFLF
jgi:hypothetical protein